MTDKERQEFVEKWLPMMPLATGYERNRSRHLLTKMLLAYDKLNGDRLERLKESVEADLERTNSILSSRRTDELYLGMRLEAKSILAEIERLEKEA